MMLRLTILFLAALLCLPSSTDARNRQAARPAPVAPPAMPEQRVVDVCSAILFDMDNDAILFEQNADQKIPPASLTKIMTIFLALDFIDAGHARLDSPVRISRLAANTGDSRMGLKEGETVRLGELLRGMAIASGNDASTAVAEFVGGSIPAFVKMMNTRAERLGMHDTHFVNPHGLPAKGQRTTARDMLTLARAYLKKHPDALSIHNEHSIKHGQHVSWNRNPLLGQYRGADGLKTGWVRASGYNLIATALRGNHRLVSVVLGAPDPQDRGIETCRILDAGFLVCEGKACTVPDVLPSLLPEDYSLDPNLIKHEARQKYGYVTGGHSRAPRAQAQAQATPQNRRAQRGSMPQAGRNRRAAAQPQKPAANRQPQKNSGKDAKRRGTDQKNKQKQKKKKK